MESSTRINLSSSLSGKAGICIAIFAFSYLTRLLFFNSVEWFPPLLRGDSAKYLLTAINLVELGVYSYEQDFPLQSSTLLVPGYPFFLSAIYSFLPNPGSTINAAFHLQLVLGAAIPVLVYLVANRMFIARLAIIPALLIAIYPHQVVAPSFLTTETLFGFLLVSAIYVLVLATERKYALIWILIGLLLTMATLTRPVLVLLAPVLLLFLWREKWAKSLLLVCGMVVFCYGLWAYWGAQYADKKVSNFRSVVALGTYPDFTYKNLRGLPNREDPRFQESIRDWGSLLSYFRERVSKDPVTYARWYAIGKPLSIWEFNLVQSVFIEDNQIQGQGGPFIYPINDSLYDCPGFFRWSYQLLEILHPVLVAIALIQAVWCCIKMFFRRRFDDPLVLQISSIVMLYATLIHVPLASLPRFSIPFQVVMAILVVAGCYRVLQFVRSEHRDYQSSTADG